MALLLGGLVGCGGPSTPVTTPVAPVTTAFQLLTPNFSALPQAVVDTPYDYALETDLGSPGVTAIGPVTFEATGAMPPGLTISRNGVISGAPAQAGSFTVPVKVIDSSSSPQTAAASYTIVVRLPGVSLTQVAHTDLGGHGQNAAVRVAVSRASGVSYAYVGTRGTAGDCPATGVKIVDLSQITNPQLVATAGAVSGASQENVRIGTGLSTPDFHSGGSGDMMAVTEQPCDPSNSNAQNAGVQFYDVTNPASPALLGTWSSGLDGVDDVAFVAVPGPTNAVGQVDHTQDKLYALVAVPGSETSTAGNGQGDLRVLDITNPADPRQIGSWGVLTATDTQLAQVVAGYDP
ncbi:MAG: putative Ig domain-containing protein, partial [Terriglobales bacterium]